MTSTAMSEDARTFFVCVCGFTYCYPFSVFLFSESVQFLLEINGDPTLEPLILERLTE